MEVIDNQTLLLKNERALTLSEVITELSGLLEVQQNNEDLSLRIEKFKLQLDITQEEIRLEKLKSAL